MVGNAALHRLRNCAAKALHIPQKSTLFHSLRLFSHYTPIPSRLQADTLDGAPAFW